MNKNNVISDDYREEYFELILNVEDSRVPIDVLCDYLKNSEKLIKSINRILRKRYDMGSEMIAIDVLALEPGSFKIPVKIKKMAKDPRVYAVIIIGKIILQLLSNQPFIEINQTNNYDNEPIRIERQVFQKDSTLNDTIAEMSQLTVRNKRIRDLSITYENSDGTLEKTTITKEMLKDTLNECDRYYDDYDIELEVLSPSFDKNTEWVFLSHNRKIKAKMLDTDFIEKINSGNTSFRKGDRLFVVMRVIPKTKIYSIIKVIRSSESNSISER